MADGFVGVKQAPDPDRFIDNEVITRGNDQFYQQRVRVANEDLAKDGTLSALLVEFRNRYDVVNTARATYSTAGPHILVSAVATERLMPVWFYAQAAASVGSGIVRVTFSLGTNSYEVELTGSQPFAHSAVWEGALDEDLIITLSAPAEVLVNVDYRRIV